MKARIAGALALTVTLSLPAAAGQPPVGSRDADSAQLEATSPARHAELVKCPVLLLHGDGDTTVPIEQSQIMYDALTAAHKPVEFVKLEGEDHYLELSATRIKMLSEIERFLRTHIGS